MHTQRHPKGTMRRDGHPPHPPNTFSRLSSDLARLNTDVRSLNGKKSTIWVAPTSPHAQSYQVFSLLFFNFFCFFFRFLVLLFHTANLSKTLTSALTISEREKKSKNRCCEDIELAKEQHTHTHKRQHLSHCLSYVFCVSISVASQRPSPLMGCESFFF